MQFVADFHLHSKYSRATSRNLSVETLAQGEKTKGLNLLGTGDFTHPLWLKELESKLKESSEEGIFEFDNMKFILTTEICTIFTHEIKTKKIHHVIHAPSFEIVEQINERLSKFGKLQSDGRPILTTSAPQVVEEIMEVDKNIFVYPAHAWTPWFGVFGSKSGFDSLEECYQDQVKNIFALETGLSSDPVMNWRLSKLDKISLLSSSDAHSANPWRLGREANVFEFDKVDYQSLHKAIKEKDPKKFKFTIEVDPNYGKYHYTGHKNCKINLHPKEATKINNICPKCGKKLTVGVLQRVEELADRPEGYTPKNAIPFKTLLPLYEIISYVTGTNTLYSKKVLEQHDKLLSRFGNELNVLLNVPQEEIEKVVGEKIANAIEVAREGKVRYVPGFDGEYGKPIFDENITEQQTFVDQKTLSEFKK